MNDTALRIDLNGETREIPLGLDPRQQARAAARAVLDAPAVICRVDHPAGEIAIIGGQHRDQHPPNFYAGLLAEILGAPDTDLNGPVLFAGVTPTDHLGSLPAEVLAEAHRICPTNPGRLPAIIRLPESAPPTPRTIQPTNEKGDRS